MLNKFTFIGCLVNSMLVTAGSPFFSCAQVQPYDTTSYPFINKEFNFLQFYHLNDLHGLYDGWKSSSENKLVVLHFGDSHVQPGTLTRVIRTKLQSEHGDAGRGMIFPYAAAKSYTPYDYTSTSRGEWKFAKTMIIPPKIRLGAMGMSIATNDPNAGFSISFKSPLAGNNNRLKLFCRKSPASFDLSLKINAGIIQVKVDSIPGDTSSCIEILLSEPVKTIEVSFLLPQPGESVFEFYGMSLESDKNAGILYHSMGVGGSRFRGILYESEFEEQVRDLSPDVVILDFGTNDFLYDNKIKPELENEIVQIIKKIRVAAPKATVILPTVQDLYWKKKNITAGLKFRSLIYRIAKTEHCAVYDWFTVSGGLTALLQWKSMGLAQADLVHLTKAGYELKGKLMAQAFHNTIKWVEANPDSCALILEEEVSTAIQPVKVGSSPSRVIHVIKKGETLSSIAKKYKTSVHQIMQLNRLPSSHIKAGDTLVIFSE